MPTVYKRPNIMFLPNVFEKDITHDDHIFDDKFSETVAYEASVPEIQHYTSIPATYTTLDKWITVTNLCCWNCDRQFKNRPIFVPDSIYFTKNAERIMDVNGVFCSFNCAQKYIDEKYKGPSRDDRTKFLQILFKDFYGYRAPIIKPAPEKTKMKKYCGEKGVTADEYQKMIEELNANYELSCYKLEHYRK